MDHKARLLRAVVPRIVEAQANEERTIRVVAIF